MFRLFKGEVMKLLRMPTIYILTIVLAALITFSFIFFHPTSLKSNTYINDVDYEQNIELIYKKYYTNLDSQYNKININNFVQHSSSEKSVEDLVAYYTSNIELKNETETTQYSARQRTLQKFDEVAQKYIDFYSWFFLIDRDAHGVDVAGTESKVLEIYTSLDELETLIKQDCSVVNCAPTTAYLIVDDDYKSLIKEIDDQKNELAINVQIPGVSKPETETKLSSSKRLIKDIEDKYFSNCNYQSNKAGSEENVYQLKNVFASITKELNIIKEDLDNITSKYKTNAEEKLSRLEQEVDNYYYSLDPSSEEANTYDAKKLLIDKISIAYSTGYYAILLAKSEIVKKLCDQETDEQFNKYLGVNELNKLYNMNLFNRYNFKQNLSKYSTIYEDEIIESNYGVAFSSSYTSNYATNDKESAVNAYDYAYYVLDIFGFIIVIFSVILASNMIAGEQKDKTMKMLAIRPYSRSQIMTAKIMAVLFFAFIFILLTMLISLIAGYFMYGISSNYLIVTLNASVSFTISPFLLYLINVLCVFFKVVFFVLLAFLISTALRSYLGATVINIFFILITLVGNNFLSGFGVWKFIPFANVDLFKYFGNGTFTNAASLFSSSYILPGTDIVFSLIVSVLFMVIVTVATYSIFKRRDIA